MLRRITFPELFKRYNIKKLQCHDGVFIKDVLLPLSNDGGFQIGGNQDNILIHNPSRDLVVQASAYRRVISVFETRALYDKIYGRREWMCSEFEARNILTQCFLIERERLVVETKSKFYMATVFAYDIKGNGWEFEKRDKPRYF